MTEESVSWVSGPPGSGKTIVGDLELYFLERPMALAVAHLLSEKPTGMTATGMAYELHVSVPTTYRLALEMWRLGLLEAEKQGRKTLYRISGAFSKALPGLTSRAEKVFAKTPAREKRLLEAKAVQATYNIPLSPRASGLLIASILKQKVKAELPGGARMRRVGPLRTVVGEPVKLDLYLGGEESYVGVELKIVETPRHLRERVGALASVSAAANPGLKGIIPAYLLSPIGGQWLMDEGAAKDLLSVLGKGHLIVRPVVRKCSEQDLLDPKFLGSFARDIVSAYKEIDHG